MDNTLYTITLYLGPKKDGEGNDQRKYPQEAKGNSKQNSTKDTFANSTSTSTVSKMHSNSAISLNPKVREEDEILCCGGCGCYGMSGEFLNSDACSSLCQVTI